MQLVGSVLCAASRMGEASATAYKVVARPLSVRDVCSYLAEPAPEAINSLPPVKPKAGEIYLYKARDDGCKGIVMLTLAHIVFLAPDP